MTAPACSTTIGMARWRATWAAVEALNIGAAAMTRSNSWLMVRELGTASLSRERLEWMLCCCSVHDLSAGPESSRVGRVRAQGWPCLLCVMLHRDLIEVEGRVR